MGFGDGVLRNSRHVTTLLSRRWSRLLGKLCLRLFDELQHGLDALQGLGAAPEKHDVDVPVAAFKTASVHMGDGFAQDERAGDELAVDEGLAGDINGLVLKRFVFVFGKYHAANLVFA